VRKRLRTYSSAHTTERRARQYNHIWHTDAGEPQAPEVYGSAANLTGEAVSAPALSRAAAIQPSRAEHPILELQRRYGNRFVQRVLAQARSEAEAQATPDVEGAIQRARGGGQALDSGTRAGMESSFGADFSGVRVHADAGADSLNRSLNARAFTTGQDIFFKQGEYSPGSSGGRELLAHELTHVVQQNGDQVQTKLTVGQPGDRYEQEADRVARAITQPEPERVWKETNEGLVQRQIEEEEPKEPIQAKVEEAWIQRQGTGGGGGSWGPMEIREQWQQWHDDWEVFLQDFLGREGTGRTSEGDPGLRTRIISRSNRSFPEQVARHPRSELLSKHSWYATHRPRLTNGTPIFVTYLIRREFDSGGHRIVYLSHVGILPLQELRIGAARASR
jgi:hypothetical protein